MINFDKASTTNIRKEVLDEMLNYFSEHANASSIYTSGQKAKGKIEGSKMKIARLLNCEPSELFFTSGGTEADNWAIKGIADSFRDKGKHIITTKIEHHAVLHTTQFLEERGYEVTYLSVDEYGIVNIQELEDAIREDTILISVMFANNEIGSIQPIKKISKIAKDNNVLFHVDAVQALGNLKIDLKELGVDLMSFSGHKINGPVGVGILYIKSGVKITPLIHGGLQENGRRAGTEDVASIVAMTKAMELIIQEYEDKIKFVKNLRDKLISALLEIQGVRLNGSIENRLVGNVNVSIDGVSSQELLIFLDIKGICASSGSACTAGSIQPSHVLKALGLSDDLATNALRLTIDYENTQEEVETVINEIKNAINTLRK